MINTILINSRRIIYISLWLIDKLLKQQTQIVVLNYHNIGDDQWFHSVSINEFKQQITYLNTKYNFINAEQLKMHITGQIKLTKPAVLLTFDDGYSNIMSITEFISKHRITPLLFTIAQPQQVNRKQINNQFSLLSSNQIKQLHQSGWDIGSHTNTHPNLNQLDDQQQTTEISQSKLHLENIIDTDIKYFSYPKGRYSDQTKQIVRNSGYQMAFSMDDQQITHATDYYQIPRIGVNKTHSLLEFKSLTSPSVIKFRNLAKKLISKSKFNIYTLLLIYTPLLIQYQKQ